MRNLLVCLILCCCFLKVASLVTPCNQPSDCKSNECCINNVRPIGKRDLDNPKGHCLPLGTEKSFCYVRYGSASHPPDQLVFGCPCIKPLICKGNGTFDMPLGETGFCEHHC